LTAFAAPDFRQMVDRHSDIRLSAAAGTVVHIAVAQDTDQIGPKDQEGQLSFDIVRNTLSYYLVDIGSDVLDEAVYHDSIEGVLDFQLFKR